MGKYQNALILLSVSIIAGQELLRGYFFGAFVCFFVLIIFKQHFKELNKYEKKVKPFKDMFWIYIHSVFWASFSLLFGWLGSSFLAGYGIAISLIFLIMLVFNFRVVDD